MKSMRDRIYILVIIMIALVECYYLFTVYKEDYIQIAHNREEIAIVNQRIEQLEKRLTKYEESKKELTKIEKQKKALLDKIPNQMTYSRYMNSIINYVKLLNCFEVEFSGEEKDSIQNEIGIIHHYSYKVSFISIYSNIRKLIEHLLNTYQAVNITSFKFETDEQRNNELDNYKKYVNVFGKQVNELGRVTLEMDVFYRIDETGKVEYYQPKNSQRINQNPFELIKKDIKVVMEGSIGSTEALETQMPVVEASNQKVLRSNTPFLVNISDDLTSGDTYMANGPGNEEKCYVGIPSSVNADINLEIYVDHYNLTVEDINGEKETTSYEYPVNQPTVQIISTMRQLSTVMPNVHVNIKNHTDQKIEVILEGSMLDNIHVYNESGEEVKKGETKGSVSLT